MSARKKEPKILGFTLVEIITVLAVIAGLLIFSYLSIPTIQARVRDARRKADLNKMSIAVAEYEDTKNCYPVALPVCGNDLEVDGSSIVSSLPCDPETDDSYIYVSENSECPSWFQLYTILEYDKDSIIDRVGCRNGCGPDCQFNYGVASPNQDLNPYCMADDGEDEDGDSDEGGPLEYVCDPAGSCEVYEDPEISGCPDIYPDNPECQNQCEDRENRCRDERGKLIPD